MNEQVLIAFGLTVFAGLSTGIGSIMALFIKERNYKFLTVAMGFSAGVMVYVSFVELFSEANHSLATAYGETLGAWITVAAFFGGIGLIMIIDKLVPSIENPHEFPHEDEDTGEVTFKDQRLLRVGIFTAVALAIHNFPEGIATFASGLRDMSLAIPIAVAVAIHNIPEGIAVSMPVYYATGSKKKAFWYSFLSGVAEPVGAFLGFLLLQSFFNDLTFGILFAGVAGIMVFISLDQLLPAAEEYGEHHLAIYGLIAGMGVMAFSLLLFQ